MKRLPIILLAVGVIALAVLVTPLALRAASAWTPVCGPGAHWVDGCGAGTDTMDPTTAVFGIDDPADGNLDCMVDQTIMVDGPVEVERQASSDDSANYPGTRPVDAHDDVIDTEITKMTLTEPGGITLKAGTATDLINPLVDPTYGAVAELPSDDELADSFFDVYFQVCAIPIIGCLYNHTEDPLRLETEIDQVPPDTAPHAPYWHPTGLCIPLYTDPEAGLHTANLVSGQHITTENLVVGGTADFPDVDGSPLSATDSPGGSSFPFAAAAGGLAALVLLAAGGWYARRRFIRS